MFQTWRHLLFLHWKVDPDHLQAMLPPGLNIDLHNGEAYVGIVPFFMCDVRPRFLPAAPGISNFLELNVRTYVHDADGIPGVWFFSLDANCAPAVWLARAIFHLPYRHAKMRATVSPDKWVDYTSTCPSGRYSGEFRYRGGADHGEAAPGSLEFFLIERYFLFAFNKRRNQLIRGQVAHAPYQLRDVEVAKFDPAPMSQQAILPSDSSSAPQFDHACMADEVTVEILKLDSSARQTSRSSLGQGAEQGSSASDPKRCRAPHSKSSVRHSGRIWSAAILAALDSTCD